MSNHREPIPEWLNERYIEAVVRKHWKQPEAVVRQILVTPGSKFGDNYACKIFRIKVHVDFGGKLEEILMIAKMKPNTDSFKVMEGQVDIFKTEATVFEILFPKIIEAGKDVPAFKNFAPKCYYVDNEKNIILMEDLIPKDFQLQKRAHLLTKDLTLLAAEALASMHGASYLAVQKDSTLRKTFETCLWSMKAGIFDKMYEHALVSLERNVDNFGLTAEQCLKLRALGKTMMEEYATKVYDFRESSLNVICHGDLWMNNMLFHFTDDVPDEVIFLDYQVTNFNCFALDLNYFLFTSVKSDVIVDNLDAILETYFNKLKAVVPEMPNLTLKKVKEEFFERLHFGLLITVLFRAFNVDDTPINFDDVFAGEVNDRGYRHPQYSADLRKLVPFFENAGVL